MPLIFYAMLALVQEFLPHLLEQRDGAILTAQGGSTVRGLPNVSGPSPAQAAQRNYLQALSRPEVAQKGMYVGMLYIGAAIENSAFHTEMEKAKSAGDPVWEMPTVDPEHRRPALDYARHEGPAGSHLSVVSRAVDRCTAVQLLPRSPVLLGEAGEPGEERGAAGGGARPGTFLRAVSLQFADAGDVSSGAGVHAGRGFGEDDDAAADEACSTHPRRCW